MKRIIVKLLLNRIAYDPTNDLKEITAYFYNRGVELVWNRQNCDLKGYTVQQVQNPFGNMQYVLTGAEQIVKPLLKGEDICILVIQGFKEFGTKCPSESENKQFIPGTKTVFVSSIADDAFSDQYPNFKIWLMHELMHAIGTIGLHAGFRIVDSMDVLQLDNGKRLFYFRNYEPENPNSNFIRTFESFYYSGFLKYE